MSDFFKDKFVDELESSDEGWLTLAIEPYTYSLLDKLEEADFPSEYEFVYDDMSTLMNDYGSVSLESVIKHIIKKNDIVGISAAELLTVATYNDHKPIFVTDNLTINFTDKVMQGKITFTLPEIDETKLSEYIAKAIRSKFYSAWGEGSADIGRLNEIMDILECTEQRTGRSVSRKTTAIRNRFCYIIANDEWRIRNCDLMLKAADWLLQACDSSMHGLANLTKLKCMTHGGKVIYSMEEIN